MPAEHFIIDLKTRKIPASVGNKAQNLRWLQKNGFPVPLTHVCDWRAYQLYKANDPTLSPRLKEELGEMIDPEKTYAVRSSANIEDSLERSFAGQFTTVLHARGVDQVLQAVIDTWDSTTSPAVQTYLERQGLPNHQLLMAVIIQEMVSSVFAGVALNRNPMTGTDEVIIEAVCGTGDALVQSGVTPCRWVKKADKWTTPQQESPIPMSLVEQVATQTSRIARMRKSDVDLEWAWDGSQLYWLQVRQITTLHRHNLYSNHMSREMLPGMIKPLVGSVNAPVTSAAFVSFMDEMLGNTGIDPSELVKFFYYRTYFNMGVLGRVFTKLGLPADSVEMMSGNSSMNGMMMKPNLQMLRHLPRMMAFVHDKWTFHNRAQKVIPSLKQRLDFNPQEQADFTDEREILNAVDQLLPLDLEVTYYNILCPILSVMHNKMLSRQLKSMGVELEQLDITEGMPEVAEHDPATHLRKLHSAFNELDLGTQQKIHLGGYSALLQMDQIPEFRDGVAAFLKRFGDLSDNNNDFSQKRWRDDPDMVLGLIMDFKSGSEKKAARLHFSDLKVAPLRKPMVKTFFKRVQIYRLLREQMSVFYTHTRGLYREYYLAIGQSLAKRNVIAAPEDVFYLTGAEIRQIISGETTGVDYRNRVATHKVDMERFRDIPLPGVIYGDEPPPVVDHSAERLTGMATSLGHYSGPTRVVRGLMDFGKVKRGDVIVIPYSDVSWSPLFALAGAVVAEAGGLLSHSSIIAREYGIPAVVSVYGAMELVDEMHVTVDGHKGEVIIHSQAVAS